MQNDRRECVTLAQREDVADKERVVTAIVLRGHPSGDRGVGVREHRRVAGIVIFRIDAFDRPPGEMTDQRLLSAGKNVHAEMPGLQQESMHARFLPDGNDA